MSKKLDFFDIEVQRDNFTELLNERRKDKKFTNVQLEVGGKLFDAHRVILSLFSPVLEAAISDQWSTTNICPLSEEYVDVEIMEDLLNFLYTGKIKLTPDNVHPVCVAAHFLQIPTLLQPSVEYLRKFITIENVLTLFKFSTAGQIEELKNSCMRLIKTHHKKIFKDPQLLEFSFTDFKDLIVGLKKFWANMLRENTFQYIIRWTEKDLVERLDHLPKLLESIPLEVLPLDYLTKIVETVSTALANCEECSKSQTIQNMVIIGGYKTRGYVQSMSCYDSRTGAWKKLPPMPTYRQFFGAAVVNQKNIVVCGGYSSKKCNETTNSMEMFDWEKQTWTKLPEMPVGYSHPSMALCDGLLYVAGVPDESPPPNFLKESLPVLCYNFGNREWKQVKRTTVARYRGELIAHKNHLYAIGGYTNAAEKYDPARDKWTMMANMKNQHSIITTLHQDKIYVYGACFEMYNPETNVWTSLPSPPDTPSTSLVSLNAKLLAVGGFRNDSTNVSDLIYEFDLSTEKWSVFGKLEAGCRDFSTVVGAFY